MNTKSSPVNLKAVDDVDSLKSDIDALRQDLKTVVNDVRGIAAKRTQKAVDKGAALAEEAGTQASNYRDVLQERVRENPLAAIGIAFGAGLVLAMLRGK